MSETLEMTVKAICRDCDNDHGRLMDIVRAVQEKCHHVSPEAVDLIAAEVGVHRVEVESVVSFYAFLTSEPTGKVVIRLCDDVIDDMKGVHCVADAFSEELGVEFGGTTEDGNISLEWTPCIGMCDQAPSALVNDVVVNNLTPERVKQIVATLKETMDPSKLVANLGDGNNAHELVQAEVHNNIRQAGEVLFSEVEDGAGLKKAVALDPAEVIEQVKAAQLRGRGGAGFPTGLKWGFTRGSEGTQRYVLCNADEGEPGTFKDRVLLTERAGMMIEGMTIAGYAIGADTGILYLRAEYAYLRKFLEHVLNERRANGLLGNNVAGKEGFNFDIRIQMGAGAYICGEESALISSCEGKRGDPKTRPPFPAQKGYKGCPTTVNNVETFCCVTKIFEKGAEWFSKIGTEKSAGTKVLSVSGDCTHPGIYEVPFGVSLKEVLSLCGAEDTAAVQVGGPSGQMVGPDQFDRVICFDDLATGGSMMVFSNECNLLQVVEKFLDFFVEESCGYCTPCRVGTALMQERIGQILDGRGEPEDLEYLEQLAKTTNFASRCGLGQTAGNPILTTLKNFRPMYEVLLSESEDGLRRSFDIQAELTESKEITKRDSVHFPACQCSCQCGSDE